MKPLAVRSATTGSERGADVTLEHYRHLREWGFVAHRDRKGRLTFIQRDHYQQLIVDGKIEPGSSVQ